VAFHHIRGVVGFLEFRKHAHALRALRALNNNPHAISHFLADDWSAPRSPAAPQRACAPPVHPPHHRAHTGDTIPWLRLRMLCFCCLMLRPRCLCGRSPSFACPSRLTAAAATAGATSSSAPALFPLRRRDERHAREQDAAKATAKAEKSGEGDGASENADDEGAEDGAVEEEVNKGREAEKAGEDEGGVTEEAEEEEEVEGGDGDGDEEEGDNAEEQGGDDDEGTEAEDEAGDGEERSWGKHDADDESESEEEDGRAAAARRPLGASARTQPATQGTAQRAEGLGDRRLIVEFAVEKRSAIMRHKQVMSFGGQGKSRSAARNLSIAVADDCFQV